MFPSSGLIIFFKYSSYFVSYCYQRSNTNILQSVENLICLFSSCKVLLGSIFILKLI